MKSNIIKQDQREAVYEEKGYWQPYTLGEHLKIRAQQYGDRIALVLITSIYR
jgi:non-ribosomal peptide synthetase component E (peptide arylation enzyme)